jgi:hypothetical protein
MRTLTKTGFTSCDWRLDRGMAALAAATAAIFLSATAAQAAPINQTLVVDSSRSSVVQTWGFVAGPDGSLFGFPSTPAWAVDQTFPGASPNSRTFNWGGTVSITTDNIANTIRLNTGSNMVANNTGNYAPLTADVTGGPASATGVEPGNSGNEFSAIGWEERSMGVTMDFGIPAFGILPTPMTLFGNNFDLAGQFTHFTGGTSALVSAAGSTAYDLTGLPMAAFGTNVFGTSSGGYWANFVPYLGLYAPVAGSDIGTWDGTTLTIPFVAMQEIAVDTGNISKDQFLIGYTGMIVATIPEPSTMTLLGFGAIGLLLFARRRRR